MKIAVLFLAAIFGAGASATGADLSLEEAVANNIQALLWDTVNEGSQTATVDYDGEKPSVWCKLSNVKNSPNKKWAFCLVDFTVTFEDSDEEVGRQCELLYSYEPAKGVKSLEREENSIDRCLENLSEGP